MQDKVRDILTISLHLFQEELGEEGQEFCLCKCEEVDPQEFYLIEKDIYKGSFKSHGHQ